MDYVICSAVNYTKSLLHCVIGRWRWKWRTTKRRSTVFWIC